MQLRKKRSSSNKQTNPKSHFSWCAEIDLNPLVRLVQSRTPGSFQTRRIQTNKIGLTLFLPLFINATCGDLPILNLACTETQGKTAGCWKKNQPVTFIVVWFAFWSHLQLILDMPDFILLPSLFSIHLMIIVLSVISFFSLFCTSSVFLQHVYWSSTQCHQRRSIEFQSMFHHSCRLKFTIEMSEVRERGRRARSECKRIEERRRKRKENWFLFLSSLSQSGRESSLRIDRDCLWQRSSLKTYRDLAECEGPINRRAKD